MDEGHQPYSGGQEPVTGPIVPAPHDIQSGRPPATGPKPTAAAGRGGSSLVSFLVALPVIVGLIMVICTGGDAGPGQSGLGAGLLVIGVPLVVSVAILRTRKPPQQPRTGALAIGAVALIVMAVSMAVDLASLTGQVVRWVDPADYTGRFGTKATVSLPEKCENDVHVSTGSGAKAADADVVCDGSTWQVAGVTHTGTVVIGWTDIDLPTGVAVPRSVQAYVLGDKGYSLARVGKVENVAAWGGVPLWWLPVGLLVTVVSFMALAKVGWITRRAKPEPDARTTPTGTSTAP